MYAEDFENNPPNPDAPILLTAYTGATGMQYDADQAWLTNCNGNVRSRTSELFGNCATAGSRDATRQQAWALGKFNGQSDTAADTNHAVTALTDRNEAPNLLQFRTASPIRLAAANRFLAFSVDYAATGCNVGRPYAQFSLLSGGTTTAAGTPIDACTGAGIAAPGTGTSPAQQVRVGRYSSNGSVLATDTSVGIELRNANGAAAGNDGAFDNIKLLDATPTLDKEFSPASVPQNTQSTLTFTVTNTTELASKNGWGFTDTLPTGLKVAGATGGTCPSRVVNAPVGGSSIQATGNLNTGMASCTITVPVTSATTGTYTNGPGNVTAITGLNPPLDTDVTFTAATALSVTKTPSSTTYVPGKDLTYSIKVHNDGPETAHPTVKDPLADLIGDFTWTCAATAPSACDTPSGTGPLDTKATVAKDGDVVYTVTGKVPANATGDIDNTVTIAPGANEFDTNCATSCSASAKVTAGASETALSIEKTSDRTDGAYVPGQPLTYTVTVKNAGPSDAVGATLTDTLPTEFNSFTWSCQESTGSACSAANGTGDLPDTTKVNVAAGGSVTYTFTGTVPEGTTGRKTNTAKVTAATGTTDANCASGCSADVALNGAFVTMTKTATPADVKAGDTVTYKVVLDNAGAGDYPGFKFTDDLSGAVDDADFVVGSITTAPSGDEAAAYDDATQKLTWTGTVPAGSKVTVTYKVKIPDPLKAGGDKSLKNAVASSGSNCPTGTEPGCFSGPKGIGTMKLTKELLTPGPIKPGMVVKYQVTAVNSGSGTYPGASFTDDLSGVLDDAAWDGTEAAVSSDSARTPNAPVFDAAGKKLTWTGDVAAGETVTVTYSATVGTPPLGDKKLNNKIVGPGCPPGSTEPECGGEEEGIANLGMKKEVDAPSPVKPGSEIKYTVTLENTGTADYPNASFTDDVSGVVDDATLTDGPDQGAVYDEPGKKITWNGPVAAGDKVVITYTFTVNTPDLGDKILKNGVSSTDDVLCQPGNTPPPCSPKPPNVASLKFIKTMTAPTPLKPGDKVSYQVLVKNEGTAPYPAAWFEDDLSDVIDDATYTKDVAAESGTASYTAPKIKWTGDVAPGQTVKVTYTAKINNPAAGNKKLTNTVVGPEDSNCGATSTDLDCQGSGRTRGSGDIAQLEYRKEVTSSTTPKPGDTVEYMVTVTNTGTADYPGATFTDDLSDVIDDATFNNDQQADVGQVSYAAPNLTWRHDLPAGAAAVVKYSVTIDIPMKGNKSLSNGVKGPGQCPTGREPGCFSGPDGIADVRYTKTSSPTVPKPGDTVNYTVVVENKGRAKSQYGNFTDDLSGVLDDGVYNGDVKLVGPDQVEYREASSEIVWTGDLDPGQKSTITYSVKLNKPATGDRKLSNAVIGPVGTLCEPGGTPPPCRHESKVANPVIRKTASTNKPKTGQNVTYTIQVENTGTAKATGVKIIDDLKDVLDDATLVGTPRADSGAAPTLAKGVLTWTGDIEPAQIVTITYTVKVGPPPKGNLRLGNKVKGPSGSNCGDKPDDWCGGESEDIPFLDINKSMVPADPGEGGTVIYSVKIANRTKSDYDGAKVTDDLTDVLDDAKFAGQIDTGGKGHAAFKNRKIVWTGDIPAGKSVTIRYAVTVGNPPAGNRILKNVVTGPDASTCAPGHNRAYKGGNCRTSAVIPQEKKDK
ncbi:DUF11 domain-containing protein [Streptomyces sp. TRM66268-LWL]|uniref:DUF11 domain-containing protein n=1 Tax=Streptomyces polyasparticus TaxID=2767826 RepID=A0ABR7SVZ9_9ACTN|nr:DUF11 domain-containing protein [Streptomyces polyasparticus]MBC9719671.1 DUF11 domain-containing protein [Streptomyces polyasparticus]